MKIPVSYIILERLEGLTTEVGKPVVSKTWAAATKTLEAWAETAPANGGYDKCKFTVLWDDGRLYEGRVDIKHVECELHDLYDYLVTQLNYQAGRYKPNHLTDEQYKHILYDEATKKDAIDILENYL